MTTAAAQRGSELIDIIDKATDDARTKTRAGPMDQRRDEPRFGVWCALGGANGQPFNLLPSWRTDPLGYTQRALETAGELPAGTPWVSWRPYGFLERPHRIAHDLLVSSLAPWLPDRFGKANALLADRRLDRYAYLGAVDNQADPGLRGLDVEPVVRFLAAGAKAIIDRLARWHEYVVMPDRYEGGEGPPRGYSGELFVSAEVFADMRRNAPERLAGLIASRRVMVYLLGRWGDEDRDGVIEPQWFEWAGAVIEAGAVPMVWPTHVRKLRAEFDV